MYMNAPKNPFERDVYIAKEFGAMTAGNTVFKFDVVTKEDADRLLGADTIIGRIGARIVISDQVPSIPSSVSPMREDLINTAGQGISKRFPSQLHQSQVIREFIDLQSELSISSQGYPKN